MVMARYRYDAKLELSAGLRANRWSGAYAKFLQSEADNPAGFDIWNNPFNVDWSTDLGGGVYKAYSARSVDLALGARYRINDKLAAYTGLVYLGKASTNNPSERGQSNTALFNTLGLSYDALPGLRLNAVVGMVNYGRKGLAPTSMPSHQAFSGIDSRIEKRGNWFGAGATFTF
jgi:long-subunit fatty acid transport protein